jgi:hypothetical protein
MPHPSQLAAHHLTLLGKTKNYDEPKWQPAFHIIGPDYLLIDGVGAQWQANNSRSTAHAPPSIFHLFQ